MFRSGRFARLRQFARSCESFGSYRRFDRHFDRSPKLDQRRERFRGQRFAGVQHANVQVREFAADFELIDAALPASTLTISSLYEPPVVVA